MKRNDKSGPVIIGIMGLHRNAGTTYITVLLAQYLCGMLGKRVAVIEESGRRDLCSLTGECKVHKKTSQSFEWRSILFLTEGGEALTTVGKDLDLVVYDLGTSYERAKKKEVTFDKGLLIYSTTPWFQSEKLLLHTMEKQAEECSKWTAVANLTTEKQMKQQPGALRKHKCISFEPDMSAPSREAILVFDSIFHKKRL